MGLNQPEESLAHEPEIVMGHPNNGKVMTDAFDQDGFLHTGDQVIMEEWLLTITDRIREIIKVTGFTLCPIELEHLLPGHSKVKDRAVLAVPDAYSSEAANVCVTLKGQRQGSEENRKELITYV